MALHRILEDSPGWHSGQGPLIPGITKQIRLWKMIRSNTAHLFAENFGARLAGMVIGSDCPRFEKKNKPSRAPQIHENRLTWQYTCSTHPGASFLRIKKRLRPAHRPRLVGWDPKSKSRHRKCKCLHPKCAITKKGITIHDSRYTIHEHDSRSRSKLATMPRSRWHGHDSKVTFHDQDWIQARINIPNIFRQIQQVL